MEGRPPHPFRSTLWRVPRTPASPSEEGLRLLASWAGTHEIGLSAPRASG